MWLLSSCTNFLVTASSMICFTCGTEAPSEKTPKFRRRAERGDLRWSGRETLGLRRVCKETPGSSERLEEHTRSHGELMHLSPSSITGYFKKSGIKKKGECF